MGVASLNSFVDYGAWLLQGYYKARQIYTYVKT